MNILTGFSDSPAQTTTFTLEDGSAAKINLNFRAQQRGWFYDLEYKNFLLTVQRIVNSPNLLRQFEKQIPFGLAVLTADGQDPMAQADFVGESAAVIVLLDKADVLAIELAKFTRNE